MVEVFLAGGMLYPRCSWRHEYYAYCSQQSRLGVFCPTDEPRTTTRLRFMAGLVAHCAGCNAQQ